MSLEKKICPQCGATNKGLQTTCLLCKSSLEAVSGGGSPNVPDQEPAKPVTPAPNQDASSQPESVNKKIEVQLPTQDSILFQSFEETNSSKFAGGVGIAGFVLIFILGLSFVGVVGYQILPDLIEIGENEESADPDPTPYPDSGPLPDEDLVRPAPIVPATPVPTPVLTPETNEVDDLSEDYDLDDSDFDFDAPVGKSSTQTSNGGVSTQIWGSNVTMRGTPNLSGRKVGTLKYYEKVTHLSTSGNSTYWKGSDCRWAYVRKSNGIKGWVFGYFVEGELCSKRDFNH